MDGSPGPGSMKNERTIIYTTLKTFGSLHFGHVILVLTAVSSRQYRVVNDSIPILCIWTIIIIILNDNNKKWWMWWMN